MQALFVATILMELVPAAGPGQPWPDDYGQALAAARQQKKPLLVVLENPEDQASQVHQVSLKKNESPDALLRHYVLCRLDVRTEYGGKMAKAFKASRVPHTAVIDKTGGWQIFRKTGRLSSGEWEAMLVKHKNGERQRPVVRRSSYRVYPQPAYCRS